MNERLEWALKYQKHKFSVIPLGLDKKPIIEWKKYQTEKATEAQVREWFDKPNPPNIGIVTGKISEITVVDVEVGGKWEHYPVTMTAKTGNGGRHLFYKYAPMSNKARVFPLTDIRGDGGYVVVAPSQTSYAVDGKTKGGKYEWIRKESTQPFPYAIFDVKPEISNWDTLLKGVNQGERNEDASKVIGKFLSVIPPEEWMTTAWQMFVVWNQSNMPPLPEKELRTVFNSIVGREIRTGKRLKQSSTGNPGVNYDDSPIKLISEIAKDITDDMSVSYPTGFKVIDEAFMGGLKDGDLFFITGATGFGKCHGKGTKILMFDGSIKNVEDVKVGDKLMGDDSQPRKVSKLHTGKDLLFNVTDNKNKESYIINKEHILVLKNIHKHSYGGKKITEIKVSDYLEKSKMFKWGHKGYRVGVDFKQQNLPIDPYFIGLWLGDGHSNESAVTTMDKEIVKYLKEFASSQKMQLRKKELPNNKASTYFITRQKNSPPVDSRNKKGYGDHKISFKEKLRNLSVLGNKHIPDIYKINDRETRLQVLAGLVDSDGYVFKNGIEIATKFIRLRDDIIFLARSLGIAAKYTTKVIKNKSYYRISLYGEVEDIPTILPRKKLRKRLQIKNALHYGIEINPLGEGNYYGFEIDGNHRYLLGDFTVTHNTTFAQTISYNLDKSGLPTVWFSFEVPVGELWRKFKDMGVTDNFQAYAPEKIVSQNIEWIKKKIIEARDAFKTKIVFIDHLGFLAHEPKNYDANISNNYSTILSLICRQLKTLALQEKVAIVLLGHVRKPGVGRDVEPTINDIKDSSGVGQESDAVIILHRKRKGGYTSGDDDLYEADTLVKIEKNRRTGRNKVFKVSFLNGKLTDYEKELDEFVKNINSK